MRLARLGPVTAALFLASLLVACGGGGGGNVTPPGGGGGGGGATPTPVPSGVGTATPSPTPTASVIPSATPTPVQTPSPNPSQTPFAYTWIAAGTGQTNGLDDQFLTSAPNTHGNNEGNLMPSDPGALPQGGGQGGAVDNVTCDPLMSNNYHVHAFVGLFVNGQEIAVPDATGMVNPNVESPPGPLTDNYPNQTIYADCFYHLHTHDASGMVHIEDPDPSGAPITASLYSVKTYLDIWGVAVNSNQFGKFAGPVTVYTSGQFSRDHQCSGIYCDVGANSYTLWTGDPTAIPLYSHEVIWYEVGSGNPDAAHLPGVNFAIVQ